MRIFISYQYFLPAYKAGGPIQSINNTAKFLSSLNGVTTYIFCSNTDLDGTVLNVQVNSWVDYSPNVKVYYNSGRIGKSEVHSIITAIQPDVIFINGLYSLPYTIYPLMYKKSRRILSVRGMLHPGALSQKSIKKRIFLSIFKTLALHKKCEYHATTREEADYIALQFGIHNKIWMVPNLPNVLDYEQPLPKRTGYATLVSVSLISPMKNILLVLQALKSCKNNITYHIYGPIKDSHYWQVCLDIIVQLPTNISVEYKGDVLPHNIKSVLASYEYFILPSKSENFGHAIYEALSVGRPVITSENTPWNGLSQANAGYNINPESTTELTALIDSLAEVTEQEYERSTKAAKSYIEEKYDLQMVMNDYSNMLGINQ